jgi:EAL domain-containing protein (putative c-di-GMP-specific phosphodiesterase class I)
LGTQQSAAAIIRAIVMLSEALNMMTIAEGVETQAQLDELIALGCTEAQGYLLGRPMTVSKLPNVVPAPGFEAKRLSKAA